MKAAAYITTFIVAATALGQATDHRDIKTPPLREFRMPQPARIELPNGMVIFLQEDRELPLIRATATIRGGERNVQPSKAGLITIYGEAWRTGGTEKYSGDQLDEMLESRAAEVETSGDTDSTLVSLDVLKNDFDFVFPLFVDLLRNPQFRQEKIELAKTQANTAIARRNDEPDEILSREARKLGYGAESPYARQMEYATIAAISREDLLDFHRRTVHPNNIILAVIGDFDAKQMEKRLRQTFGSWKRGPIVPKPDPDVRAAAPGVYFIPKDDVTQSNIAMVHPGTERNNPDYHAIVVMNEIFSGGFSGRLLQTLRSQRGLTYGVGGGIGANWDYPGLFRVQMATKSGTTLESIDALKDEIARMVDQPVTAEELSLAKESILNAFVFTMDTRAKALNQQVLLEFYGFPRDYFVRYPAEIGNVSAGDVARVAKKYIHPDQLALLVIGKEADFEKPLSTLGDVKILDITIPQPGARGKTEPPRASDAEGMAIANKVLDFVGGKAAIDALESIRHTANVTMQTPQGPIDAEVHAVTRYPDSQRTVMKLPMGEVTRVVTPSEAFIITPAGAHDLPSSQREAALAELRIEIPSILKNVGAPGYTFTAGGSEKIGDVEARVLEINAAGSAVKWFVDPATGQLLRTAARATAPVPGESVIHLSDWKKFGDLVLPTATVTFHDGEQVGQTRITAIELNPTIEAKTFEKPE